MPGRILVYGGSGALGRSIVARFRKHGWTTASVDFAAPECAASRADEFIQLSQSKSDTENMHRIKAELEPSAIMVNAAGGWQGGPISDESVLESTMNMVKLNTMSAVSTAHLATTHLTQGGLVVLIGAYAALGPTPNMVGYGLSKTCVHQLVSYMVDSESCLPAETRVAGILPTTIDTPTNRKAMPGADYSVWTPCDDISDKIYAWGEEEEIVHNGGLYAAITEDNATRFVVRK